MNNSNKDKILTAFVPIEKGKEQISIESNIKTLNCLLDKETKPEENELQAFVKLFCDDVLQWQKKTGEKVNIFHAVAKGAKHVEVLKHLCYYLHTFPDDLLLKELQNVDEEGNTALHIAVQGNTSIFLDGIENLYEEEVIDFFEFSHLSYEHNKAGKTMYELMDDNEFFADVVGDYITRYKL